MKAVVQRVRDASVTVDGKVSGSIARGLLVYLGVGREDTEKDAEWFADKIANLRIFEDAQGKMNLSLKDILAETCEGVAGVLAVSQFTLFAEVAKGRRPYYGDAAEPDKAKALYTYFMEQIRGQGLICESGVFQAHMDVRYTNDGPVTIVINNK